MLIRIYLRPNLINPFLLIICTIIRQIISRILTELYIFEKRYILLILMFFGETVGGLILFIYHYNFLKNKKKSDSDKKAPKTGINIIQRNYEIKRPDGQFKIIFLILISAYFDYLEFIFCFSYLPKFYNISLSLLLRLCCLLTIFSSLIMHFLLKFKIHRHQFYSLIVIGICLILIIITELCFQKIDQLLTYGEFMVAVLYLILIHVFLALIDCIEKYLFEFNYIDQFQLLLFQGLFGTVMSFVFYMKENPLTEIIYIYNNNSFWEFILFIFLLFLYSVFSGLKNVYRVATTKIFNPVTKSLADYIMNPFYITYYYIVNNDFFFNNKRNIYFFLINLILSLIIDFCGLVYDEFIILFFWGLEHETHREISKRAVSSFSVLMEDLDEDDNL